MMDPKAAVTVIRHYVRYNYTTKGCRKLRKSVLDNALESIERCIDGHDAGPDRYRWHNIRKDPQDLPEKDRVVLVAPEYNTMFGLFVPNHRKQITAWKYVEKYEE